MRWQTSGRTGRQRKSLYAVPSPNPPATRPNGGGCTPCSRATSGWTTRTCPARCATSGLAATTGPTTRSSSGPITSGRSPSPRANIWLSVPGLLPRTSVPVALNTSVAPSGTLRLTLGSSRVEVHYQIDADDIPSSRRPCGDRKVGVDKGYTEVLTDSDGLHHGPEL